MKLIIKFGVFDLLRDVDCIFWILGEIGLIGNMKGMDYGEVEEKLGKKMVGFSSCIFSPETEVQDGGYGVWRRWRCRRGRRERDDS